MSGSVAARELISGSVSSLVAATTTVRLWARAASSRRKGKRPLPAIRPSFDIRSTLAQWVIFGSGGSQERWLGRSTGGKNRRSGLVVGCVAGWYVLRLRARREVEAKSIEPEALYALMNAKQVLLYDVRQPLDFLAHAEIIPGATRIAPKDIAERTASFSRDQNSVIYCTGGDEETCKMVLGKARALNFTRVKLLKGGLAAWKEKGYPVEAYKESFQLDTAT